VVRGVVTAIRPLSKRRAIELMRTVSQFAEWAAAHGISLDIDALLRPDHVERYIATGCPQLAESSRGTRRAALRRAGRAATTKTPWPPAPPSYHARTLSAPYSPSEVDRFWAAAAAQRTPALRRTATALLALGLGAGLIPREFFEIRGPQVQVRSGLVVLHLTGRRERVVPVLRRYVEHVRLLAAEAGDGLLTGHALRPEQESRHWHVIRHLDLPTSLPPLRTARLRSTWLVSLMSMRVQIDELLEAAGIATTKPLQDLVPFVPRRDDGERLRALAGG
jgi:integrase